jgi:hypothetical protein
MLKRRRRYNARRGKNSYIGKSKAVEVLERSAGARFTVIALPGQRWPHAISADLILVAAALAA